MNKEYPQKTSREEIFSCPVTVESIPGCNASAMFIPSNIVFRESGEIVPVPVGDSGISYIPWGADNMLPFRMIDRFEADETLSACIDINTETCYAGGISYGPDPKHPPMQSMLESVENFFDDNDMSAYTLGIARDLKMFEFAVSVLILSEDGTRILNIFRKEAAYCRFEPAEPGQPVSSLLYADWRRPVTESSQIERIPLIDPRCMSSSMQALVTAGVRKMAVVTRIPAADSLYYPIPSYGSLFRGKWYNIKQFIAVAKEAKIKNSAPIKYLIEISNRYWEELFRQEHIVDPLKKLEKANAVKQEMIEFITGAENSGKALFANFWASPDGREIHDVKITKIESETEGGDWASDHAEAINMICFAMRVHSNLVGSVPQKSSMNNSGSDKRELYTIAQALQKSYRDIALHLHRFICRYNGWRGIIPSWDIIQLTTLDTHKDSQNVSLDRQKS